MAYVPPHLRRRLPPAAATVNTTRRIKFIGNATGTTNVLEDTGIRYSPRANAVPARRTLKVVRVPTPNAKPPRAPTKTLRHAAPKFAEGVRKHLGIAKFTRKPRHRKGKRHGKHRPKK